MTSIEANEFKDLPSPWLENWAEHKKKSEETQKGFIPRKLKKSLSVALFVLIFLSPFTVFAVLSAITRANLQKKVERDAQKAKLESLLNESYAEYLQGDFLKAEQLANLAILENADVPRAYLLAALACIKLKRYNDALENLDEASKINPNYDSLYFAYCICYHNLRDVKAEKKYLARNNTFDYPDSYAVALQYYALLGDYTKMFVAAKTGEDKYNLPEYIYWQAEAALLLGEFKLAKNLAKRLFDKVYAANTPTLQALAFRVQLLDAEIYYANANFDSAKTSLTKALLSRPTCWKAASLNYQVLWRQKEYKNALQILEAFGKPQSKQNYNCDVSQLYVLRGKAYEALRKLHEARQAYLKLLRIETSDFATPSLQKKELPKIAKTAMLRIVDLSIQLNDKKTAKRYLTVLSKHLDAEIKSEYEKLVRKLASASHSK